MNITYPEPFDGYEYTDNFGGVHNALYNEWKTLQSLQRSRQENTTKVEQTKPEVLPTKHLL